MQTLRKLAATIAQQTALQKLTETYEDMAVFNMQQIRQQVLDSRQFLEGVSEIYHAAKTAYLAQIPATLSRRARDRELSFILRNRKTVVVLISGNEPLLGNILLETYKVFLELLRNIGAEVVVCGRIGRYLATHARPALPFAYFDIDDYKIDGLQVDKIVSLISQFSKILVVYPKFDSVLVQVPQIDDVSGGVSLEQAAVSGRKYYFEPSAFEVMSYFEGQIIKILFEQKLLEAMLARFSARLTVMDRATQTVLLQIAKNRASLGSLLRRRKNKEQLAAFAGISLWGKG